MKLGFFTMPIHPVGRSLLETLNEDRELAVIAEKLGFVEGFYGEHLTDAAGSLVAALRTAIDAHEREWAARRSTGVEHIDIG